MSAPLTHALVTGGAGFIGHHLVRALLAQGLAVTVLDDLSMGKRENVPAEARFVHGDLRDPAAVADALAGVDCVFHEAAIVSIRASLAGFHRDADVNFMGTLTLMQAMARQGVIRHAVLASSMAVYSDSPTPEPLTEAAPKEPISPYGVAKLAAEQAWALVCDQAGIPHTVLRYFNTYGPNQTPTPYVGVITIFITKLLAGELPVVFGDGEQRRDFVHVDDIVSANLAVLAAGARAHGGVFNVGTGHATSVNDIATALVDLLAPGQAAGRAEEQAGELRNAIADASALRALGWSPQHEQVDFASVVDWWRERAAP